MNDTTPDPSKMSPAERLALAGAVAPILRRKAGSGRRITTVDREGKPVRVVDDVALAKSLLARSAIEFSVQDDKRPTVAHCKTCGLPIKIRRHNGKVPTRCYPGTHNCAECGVKMTSPGCRNGKLCLRCSRRATIAATPIEVLRERARHAASKITPEQRAQNGRASWTAKTEDQRREKQRLMTEAAAARSPDERRASSQKSHATDAARRTAEQRRAQGVKAGKASVAVRAERKRRALTTAAGSATGPAVP